MHISMHSGSPAPSIYEKEEAQYFKAVKNMEQNVPESHQGLP